MKKMRYVLYARKSTESEDKQVQSIDSQVYEMQKTASSLGLNVIAEFRESKSAKSPMNRPEFSKMIKMIEKGEADAILAWHINRLSRNPAESGLIQQLLQDEKIKSIHTHDKVYYPDDNAVIYSVEASISNQFIRDLRKSVIRGVGDKARDGGISGRAPQGYLNNRIDKTIEPDPIRFGVVRKMFDMCLEGYSINEIRLAADQKGYLTPKSKKRGGVPISNSMVHWILTNPRYAGIIPDPFKEGVSHKAKYIPMITIDEYDAVQRKLGAKGKPRLCASKSFKLKGILRCGECGCMITASEKFKTRVDGTKKSYIYYHCTRKRPCSQKSSLRESHLEALVTELLSKYTLAQKQYEWGIKALKKLAHDEIKQREDIEALSINATDEIQKQLDVLLDLTARGIISAEKYEEKSTPLEEELKHRKSEANESEHRTKNWYEFIGKTLENLVEAHESFNQGSKTTKNMILESIGKNPVIIDKKLFITPYNWIIPIEKHINALTPSVDEVRTDHLLIGNDQNGTEFAKWYTRQDSNLWPSAPQADALSS